MRNNIPTSNKKQLKRNTMGTNSTKRNIQPGRLTTGGKLMSQKIRPEYYFNNIIANMPEDQIKEMHQIKPKHATVQKHYKQYVKLSKKYAKKPNKETLNQAMSHYIKAHTHNTNIHTHNLKTKPAGQK